MPFLALILLIFINSSYACTTIIVGKNATINGKTIISRTSDTIDARRAKNLEFYFDREGNRSYIGFPYEDLAHNKNFDMPQVVTNRYGLSVSATETIQSNFIALTLDPPSNAKYTAISEPNLPALVMPFAKNAEDAVTILGRAIEKFGVYSEKGFGVLIADNKDAWYLETLSGHQWVAIKIPQDVYFVAANGPHQIQEYIPEKYTYKFSNYNNASPIDFALKYGIAKFQNGHFNFRSTYADIENPNNPQINYIRIAYVQHYFNPSTHFFHEQAFMKEEFPMFLVPEKKISVQDIQKLQASHYEDFPDFDPYLRENKDEREHPFFYPIANFRTSNAHVTEISDPDIENDYSISNLQYVALGMPTISYYLPIYYGLTKKPDMLTQAHSVADNKSLFWQFRKLQSLVFYSNKAKNIPFEFNKRARYVQNQYQALANEMAKKQSLMEKAYQKTRDNTLIDAFTDETLEKVSLLNQKMIDHFMKLLDINSQFGLTNDNERNQWFTNLVHQQDCAYLASHCLVDFNRRMLNRLVDEPIM